MTTVFITITKLPIAFDVAKVLTFYNTLEEEARIKKQ
jgi:hypothetical protein